MSLSDPGIEAGGLSVDVLAYDDGLMLALAGEFDLTGAERFREAFETALAADRAQLIVDFTELRFIDSSGIAQLVAAINRLAASDRQLGACGIDGQVRRVLELVGVQARLQPVNRPADAIAWPD